MRILLGWAWTYLIIAELIGVTSGITLFINQQAKYRAYDKVFSSIILIGFIGLGTDMFLARLGRGLFPWVRDSRAGWISTVFQALRSKRTTAPADELASAGDGVEESAAPSPGAAKDAAHA